MFNQLNNIMQILKNPQSAYNYLMQNNPQFAQFVRANAGKTPEQIARDYGIDINAINQLISGCIRL